MKRTTISAAGLAMAATCFGLLTLPAFGADSGTVDANVTVAAPCITVGLNPSASALDFGVASFGTEYIPGTRIEVASCGVGPEQVSVRGANAKNGTQTVTWSLMKSVSASGSEGCFITSAGGPGINQYAVIVRQESSSGQIVAGSKRSITTMDSVVESALAPGSMMFERGSLCMPPQGSSGAGEAMSFQITYTASL